MTGLRMVEGLDSIKLSTVLKDEARLFTFIASKSDATTVAELGLPEDARVICYYRKEQFFFADGQTSLKKDDEVVLLTRSSVLSALQERWDPQQAGEEQTQAKFPVAAWPRQEENLLL